MNASRIAVIGACLAFGACSADADDRGRLVVSAAVSVSDALRAVANEYARDRPVKVVLNVAGSDTLATQLIAGARVDLFLSADERQMDRAEAAGRIQSSTRVNLLTNQLVVVVPTDQTPRASGVETLLMAPWVRYIAMGDPDAVPAGVYARQYLESVGIWDAVRSKVVPVRDVRAALAAVDAGNADVGIVYRTDLVAARRVREAFAVPVDEGPHITYPMAMLADARNRTEARRFLGFLRGPEARAIFKNAGFLLLTGGTS